MKGIKIWLQTVEGKQSYKNVVNALDTTERVDERIFRGAQGGPFFHWRISARCKNGEIDATARKVRLLALFPRHPPPGFK